MKNLFQTILQGLSGSNGEGSSKRWAAFNYNVLLSYLVAIYGLAYAYVVYKDSGSPLHSAVQGLLWPIVGTIGGYALSSLGITYFDKKLDTKKEVELKKAESDT
jgi:hypothetical protein